MPQEHWLAGDSSSETGRGEEEELGEITGAPDDRADSDMFGGG
jgi:hypothetical protein